MTVARSTRRSRPFRLLPLLGAAGLAGLVLGGCTSIIPGADRNPPQLYELRPASGFAANLPRIRAQLLVETPTASASLRSSRIAVKMQPTKLDYLVESEWTDLATNLLQTLLVESFDNSSRIAGVARQGSGLRTDYLLKSDLREFHAEMYKGAPARIRIRIHVRLVRWTDRDIVASRTFEASSPLAGESNDAIVAGFDTAIGGVLNRVVEWSLRRMHRESRRRAGG
ncbi:MAG: ABC-type transport auxiliary lipoprotein family protein [Rhodospirillaceae bacterium]|nr:ABC-type transport auxiliary lipoprotein family protein [Rhodospirillaceae bacterium]